MRETIELLLSAGSGTEALRRLLTWYREQNSKYSYAWIAKQLGLSSKGHIADILSGRRVLVPRLWEPCLAMIGVKGFPLKYCRLLLEIEQSIDAGEDVDPARYDQLQALRKSLQGEIHRASDRLVTHQLILQIHSVFGLYKNRPTRRELIQFFGRQHAIEVDHALQILISEGMVIRLNDHYQLKDEARHVMVLGPQPELSKVLDFLKQGLDQSKLAMDTWATQRDLACFRSAHVSVRKAAYIKQLDSLRDEMLRMQNEMATEDGDMLIRIDFQIYPVGEKGAPGS
jgi:uncharacterized protein (TIGR02147 family)